MKQLLAIILCIGFGLAALGQSDPVTLRIGSDEGIPGTEVVIPVTVEDFSDILSMQGTITFDETLLQFIGTESYGLSGMTAACFGTNQSSSGLLAFSWYDATLVGKTVSDGSILFALRFEITGNTAQSTPIQLTSDITPIEVVDNLLNTLTVFDQTGQVTILDNPNPGSELTLGFSNHTVSEGSEILVPVEVSNFNDMISLQGSFTWDPAVLTYVSTEAYNLPDMSSGNFGTTQTASGKLTFSWNDIDLSGESLSDGQNIFSLRFLATGSAGEQSPITLDNQPTPLEFADLSLSPVDYTLIPGTLSIESSLPDSDLSIHADSVEGGIGSIVQVPVRVNDFTDIISLQASLSFDASIAEFDTISQYGLPSFAYANFGTNNASSGSISFSWNDPTLAGVSLSEDSAIFVLQFTLIGNIGDISPLDFIDLPTPLECVKNDFSVLSTSTVSGQIEIIDLYNIEITNVSDSEFCAGESFNIDYYAEGNFLPGNTYSLELSDENGDFTSPSVIGSISSNTSGSINANLPADLTSGAYKIRLTANIPVYISDHWDTNITIHQLPTANAGENIHICIGGSSALTATGGVDYLWNTGAGTANLVVTPTLDTEYSVTVTDAFGCQDADTVLVTVNPLPTANAGLDQDICIGETATLSALGGVNYEWSNGDLTQNTDVNPISNTEYFVTVTDANGCTNSNAVMVNVFEVIADAGTDQDICAGESITLTATGGTDYQWSSGDNTISTTVSPLVDTEYYVTVTGVNLCQDVDTVLVTVHQLPSANAGEDVEICIGETSALTATGGVDYLWNTGAGTANLVVTPTLDTEYSVTITDAFGCQDADTVLATVNPLPNADAGTEQYICLGETATLSSLGGVNYEWSNGDLTQNSDVNPITDTEYFVTVTDANGCTNTDAVMVNVFEVSADAGTDQDICAGESITLTATGGTDYQWSSGDNTISTTVSPLVDTEYYVTVTGVNLCQDVDTVLVTVHQLPSANAGEDVEICIGETSALTATGGVDYLWNTGAGTANLVVTPTLDTEYSVTITDAFGCQDADTVLVTVNPLPTADAGLDQDICLGETATLSSLGGVNYEWSNGDLTQNTDVTPISDTEYFVTVTDANGCTNSDAVMVNVFEVIADAGTDQDICAGESITLTATGGTDYQWSSGDNTISTTVSPLVDTEYFVTVTGVNLCQNIDTVIVTIHQLPTANAGEDIEICFGGTSALTATGGVDYLWNTGAGTANLVVTPTLDTEYSVTVTDAFGCQDADTVLVTVNPLPTANAGLDQDICLGETATLSALGGFNYEWSNGDLTQNTDANPITDTEYFVTVTDANGCTNSNAVMVNVFEVIADAGTDQDICAGESITLTATGGTDYQWSSGDNTASTTISPLVDTEYYVTVTGVNLCQNIDTVIVTIHQLPTANAGEDIEICFGGTSALTATGGVDYLWNTGAGTANLVVTPTLDTEYSVTVTDAFGCQDADTVLVTVNPLPTADAGLDQDICLGETATLSALGGVNYEWSNGNLTQNTDVNPISNTEYFVTVTDANGCTNTDAVMINVFEVIADAGTDQDICAGESITLTATGGTDYQWSSGDNTTSTTVTPLVDTEYYVTVNGVNLCQDVDTLLVTVNTLPTAPAIPTGTVERCSGIENTEYLILSTEGSDTYSWFINDEVAGILSFEDTLANIEWNSNFYGEIELFVSAENQCGNANSDTLTITVHQTPEFSLGNDTTICFGDSILLSAPVYNTYIWSTGSSDSEIYAYDENEFWVEVNSGICSFTDSISISISNPEFEFENDTIFTDLPYELLAPTGFAEYLWSEGETSESISVTEFGWNTLTLTDEFGCSVTDSVYIDDNTSIFVKHENTFSFYPNPTNKTINIISNNESFQIRISNINGKCLKNAIFNSKQIKLDVSNLPPGIYLLEYDSNKHHKVNKLIIE